MSSHGCHPCPRSKHSPSGGGSKSHHALRRSSALDPRDNALVTPTDNAHPYASLTPDRVLDALAAVGLRGDGRLLALGSYENRVYQAHLEDGSAVVAKFYRPGRWSDAQILEEHAFATELASAEVPVVAPCVLRASAGDVELLPSGPAPTLARRRGSADGHRWSVSPRRAGRAPDLEDPEVLQRLGGFIGRMHAVGARRAFAHRHELDPPRDLRAAVAVLDAGGFVPPEQQGDCHIGNLLWRASGAHVVDLDDACNGPAVQDLWMLLSGDPQAMARQLRHLLDGYAVFHDFDRTQLRLLEPLRLLRMVRHNAWIAGRWSDPAFPAAFPGFGAAGWWSQQAMQLREQLRIAAETPTLDL